MAREVKYVQIDGQEYELTQLGALDGLKVQGMLQALLEPASKSLAESEHFDERAVGAALGAVFRGLTPQTMLDLAGVFMSVTRVRTGANEQGQPTWALLSDHSRQVFDQHFSGRLLSMNKWLWESLKHNFSDFLGTAAAGGLFAGMDLSRFVPPTSSTGSSGE